MLIKVDTRESELLKKCQELVSSNPKFSSINIISETLPLGDILINNGSEDCIIVERKTLSDLAASIKDGRYEEQSYRLNGIQHHNHNIVYLIEGDMYRFNAFKDRLDKQTLYSAMFSLNYYKGFSVMRTTTLDETAQMCCTMAYKIHNSTNKVAYYRNQKQNENQDNGEEKNEDQIKEDVTEKDYCGVIKKVKKENITATNIGEIMLCQIPGVSSASALAILQEFKTLPNLIKMIQENENCLNNVCTIDAKGKSRKISKTTIATIVSYLKA